MAAPVDAGYGPLTVGNADPIIENSSQVSLHVPRTDYQERIQQRQVEQIVHVPRRRLPGAHVPVLDACRSR